MTTTLWSRDYVLALVVNFFVALVFFMLMTTMALYAVEKFGAGEALAGLVASMFIIGAVVARLGAGVAVDTLGRRRVLLVSLLVYTAAAGTYLLAEGIAALLVVRFVHGLGFGTAHTAVNAIAQSHIPAARRAEGTGYLAGATILATAVGPAIAVLLATRGPYDTVFLTAAAAGLLASAAGLWLREPSTASPTATSMGPRRRTAPIELRALPIASVALVGALAYSGVVAFVNSYAASLDRPAVTALFFVVFAAVTLTLRPFAGRLQDARGDNVVVYPAILVFAAGFAVLALAGGTWTLLTAAALLGAGWGTITAAGQAIAIGKVPISHVGKTVSTYFLLVDVGMGVGPVLLGAVILGRLDFRWMYGVLAGVVLLSAGLYYVVHGRSYARSRADRSALGGRRAGPGRSQPAADGPLTPPAL